MYRVLRAIYWRWQRLKLIVARKFKKITPIYVPLLYSDLLKGRCALITGGTRGIGYEMALAFLRSGAKVVITGRDEQGVQKAVEQLKAQFESEANVQNLQNPQSAQNRVFGIALDNQNIKLFESKFSQAVQLCGKIDVLVNNAGVIKGGAIGNLDEQGWDETFAVNLKSAAFMSEIASKYMIENKIQGNILNVCSSSSLRPGVSPYTLTKWGLRSMTLGLAKSLVKHGIIVNGIAPGPTATEMLVKDGYDGLELESLPAGRYGTAQEIANWSVALVSNMGRMVVGDILYVTGGGGAYHLRRHQILEKCGFAKISAFPIATFTWAREKLAHKPLLNTSKLHFNNLHKHLNFVSANFVGGAL